MQELEIIHADIHITARKLVALHKEGKTQEARNGLSEMEAVADHLVAPLGVVEQKVANDPAKQTASTELDFKFDEYNDLLRSNAELDKRIKQQIKENNASELKYEAVLAALHEGVIIQDENSVLISTNRSAERLLRMTADQMRGLTSNYALLLSNLSVFNSAENLETGVAHLKDIALKPMLTDAQILRDMTAVFVDLLKGFKASFIDLYTQKIFLDFRLMGLKQDIAIRALYDAKNILLA